MMTANAFRVMPMDEEEVIPDKIKICNGTGRAAYFSVYEDRGSLLIILVTADVAGEINVMEDREHPASDTV